MTNHQHKEKQFLMTLKPLKPRDRYQHTISYDFEIRHPKRAESLIDLPIMHFSKPSWVPAFMAPYEKSLHHRDPKFLSDNFNRRLERGNEDELKMLMLPKPPKKSHHCGVCSQNYEDYHSHITSEAHKNAFRKHVCLKSLYRERDEIHTQFIQNRYEYINAASSSETSSNGDGLEYMLKFEDEQKLKQTNGDNKYKNNESNDEGNNSSTESQNEPSDGSSKENQNLLMFNRRNQIKKSNDIVKRVIVRSPIKPYRPKDDNEATRLPSNESIPLRKKSESLIKQDEDSHMEISLIMKSRVKAATETSNQFNEDDVKGNTAAQNETGRDLKRSCKRTYPNFNENNDQEEVVSMLKKVKISDMDESYPRKDSNVKMDLQEIPRKKWEDLKNSFKGVIDSLKDKVSNLCGRWKK